MGLPTCWGHLHVTVVAIAVVLRCVVRLDFVFNVYHVVWLTPTGGLTDSYSKDLGRHLSTEMFMQSEYIKFKLNHILFCNG